MLDGAAGSREKTQQIAKSRLVENAAAGSRRSPDCHRLRDPQREKGSIALEGSAKISVGDQRQLAKGHRAADESGKQAYGRPSRRRHGVMDLAGKYQPCVPEQDVGVGPAANERAESLGFGERDLLAALECLVVSADLRVDRVAEPESLVPKFCDIFCLALILRRIQSPDGFEKAEGNTGIDGPGHLRGDVRRVPASAGSEETYCNLVEGERLIANFPSSGVAHLLEGAAVATLFALLARSRRMLSAGGTLAGILIAAVCVAAGWDWGGLLIAFFSSATALSRTGETRKRSRAGSDLEKGSERDARQVLANGGVLAAAAAGFLIWPLAAWQVAGAAAIASATADTWATEIGMLSSESPRSIISWRKVAAGTSGGVTALGTLAALAGAVMIGLVAIALGWPQRAACAAILGGFGGSMIDSLLGATVQARRWCAQCQCGTERAVHDCGTPTTHSGGISWLDNDVVNAVSTFLGAAIGLACLL
jgi:uncharacterized protein (TIGR00297 family)